MKLMAVDPLDEQRELSGFVLCNWSTSLSVPYCPQVPSWLQQVSQEREEFRAADFAGPSNTQKNNSLCLDPGRMEVCTGKRHPYRQPLPEVELHGQAWIWDNMAPVF